ncbi:uncharacterized protein LOC104896957 isoform X2 [Beta vulgaris subsp. vulgaris]|uniref:uncharacterized protein LOC104896957 isoform X2 n=1 Tax=Beta vulgaris subsp. vulgaris TaxID=3555 RepID=UPI0025489832|nr:uncharacterized protein LOC104896957 isoform X2 [Beta vulgaris subsp. vulgaris]
MEGESPNFSMKGMIDAGMHKVFTFMALGEVILIRSSLDGIHSFGLKPAPNNCSITKIAGTSSSFTRYFALWPNGPC